MYKASCRIEGNVVGYRNVRFYIYYKKIGQDRTGQRADKCINNNPGTRETGAASRCLFAGGEGEGGSGR